MVGRNKSNNGLLGLGDLVDRLAIVNVKISMLEKKVRHPETTNEEAGKCAKLIRKMNVERNNLRNIINEWSGTGFENINIESLKILEGK